jgi:hypothetical protein
MDHAAPASKRHESMDGGLEGKSPRSNHPAVSESRLLELSQPLEARRLESAEDKDRRAKRLAAAMKEVLECLGEDPGREGLRDTPDRAAEALLFWTRGYWESLPTVVNNAVFSEDHNEMVIVAGIEVFSLCEHHLAPFFGKAHVGYMHVCARPLAAVADATPGGEREAAPTGGCWACRRSRAWSRCSRGGCRCRSG